MNQSQRNVLSTVESMSIMFIPDIVGIPLYKGEGRIVYVLAAYDTLECWQYREGEFKQLDSIDPPDTLPALFGKLSYWAHFLF